MGMHHIIELFWFVVGCVIEVCSGIVCVFICVTRGVREVGALYSRKETKAKRKSPQMRNVEPRHPARARGTKQSGGIDVRHFYLDSVGRETIEASFCSHCDHGRFNLLASTESALDILARIRKLSRSEQEQIRIRLRQSVQGPEYGCPKGTPERQRKREELRKTR